MNPFQELTPIKIVEYLDKYIVGQYEAKKAVAIALRNRYRRQLLPPELREEVVPKNIIMIGTTGVGKTEIARRLAQLVQAPFLKVEATKYTEVGYYGRDVDAMVRDLVEISINMVRSEALKDVEQQARTLVEERLLDLLLPHQQERLESAPDEEARTKMTEARERMCATLQTGKLDDRLVEINVEERPVAFMQAFTPAGMEEVGMDFQNMLGDLFKSRKTTKKLPISEARRVLQVQESEKLLDKEKVMKEALHRAENQGIIFIDEIDKIVGSGKSQGPDVSREGVQRDLLPIVEGSTVTTRYGPFKTHHILFIAAGAFHVSKPTDLIPELQGRFPIRVELSSLTKADFIRILTEPKNALLKQYQALLEVEDLQLTVKQDAIDVLADFAMQANSTMQNIGARRLYTVLEKVLEDVAFNAPDNVEKKIVVDGAFVRKKLQTILDQEDLRRYML